MSETALNTYSVTSGNASNTSSNSVAVVNDGTANRQIVVLGAGDGTAALNDGSAANPLQINVKQVNGVATSMGNGTSGTGVQRVTIASDSTGQIKLAASAGTAIGAVTESTSTTGGSTSFTLISAATTNATSVKTSAGTLYTLHAYNNGTGVAYLKLFNKASAPTVGTDTAVMTIMLPASGGATIPIPPQGIAFGTGIAYCVTGGGATSDTTAVAATQVFVNGSYA